MTLFCTAQRQKRSRRKSLDNLRCCLSDV